MDGTDVGNHAPVQSSHRSTVKVETQQQQQQEQNTDMVARKALTEQPKKVANLIDLANIPSTLRDFVGQSQISRLGCFINVWSYVKANNLLDPNNRNVVNCDDKLKSILLGKAQVELAELPGLIKLHFQKVCK